MSKGLEALNRTIERLQNGEKIIVRDYNTIEKELKALEIIIKKRVNVGALLKVFIRKYGLQIYNSNCEEELTQEEYDLLKEVLL